MSSNWKPTGALTPVPTAPLPLCVSCAHHQVIGNPDADFLVDHRCSHPELRNLVDGSPTNCSRMRGAQHLCGARGAFFAAKAG